MQIFKTVTLRTTIHDFVRYANNLNDKIIKRPYSALTNYSLALNLFYSSPFKSLDTQLSPPSIYENMKTILDNLSQSKGNEGEYAKILYQGFNRKYLSSKK